MPELFRPIYHNKPFANVQAFIGASYLYLEQQKLLKPALGDNLLVVPQANRERGSRILGIANQRLGYFHDRNKVLNHKDFSHPGDFFCFSDIDKVCHLSSLGFGLALSLPEKSTKPFIPFANCVFIPVDKLTELQTTLERQLFRANMLKMASFGVHAIAGLIERID